WPRSCPGPRAGACGAACRGSRAPPPPPRPAIPGAWSPRPGRAPPRGSVPSPPPSRRRARARPPRLRPVWWRAVRSAPPRRTRAAAPSPDTRGRSQFDLLDERAHVLERGIEQLALVGVHLHLEHALDAARADDTRHAHVEARDTVLALEQARAREHALLVAQVGLGHRDRRQRGGDERGPGLEQRDDLAARVLGPLHD